jgi:hypothetical protein
MLGAILSTLGEEDAADPALVMQLLERRAGLDLPGLCAIFEGVIARRHSGAARTGGAADAADAADATDGEADEAQLAVQRAGLVLRDTLDFLEEVAPPEEPDGQEAAERQRELLRGLRLPPRRVS